MLAFFRRSLTSWPVLALFGLILVAFAITGVNDPLGGSAPAGSVAKVGERTITEPDLLQAIDRTVRDLRQRDPNLTQAEAARQGVVELMATQLIGQTAMEEMGGKAGLSASDTAVDVVITGIPAFQSGGKFDQGSYDRALAQQGLTDKRLRQSIARDLVREQLIKPVTGALAVPDGVAELYARLLVDRHEGAVATIPAPPAGAPTAAEAQAWYKANSARFTIPERRGFRYAIIDRAQIAAGVTLSDKAIADEFAKDPAKYGGAATRVLEQVVVPDEAKAKAIVAAAGTQGFAAAAQTLAGFGASDIALGSQTQAGFARATSSEVAKAAFALPVGGVSAPIKSGFGWHVVRVASLGSAGKSLAQARPAVEAGLKERAIEDAVADVVASIEDGVEAGKSFADIAREASLIIKSQTPVTDKGLSIGGLAQGQPPLTGELATIAARAFKHEPADGPVVEDIGGGKLVVIETATVLPAAPPPIAEVMPLAMAGAAQDKAMKAAKVKADAVLAATKKGVNFAKALADAGLASPRPLNGRRIDIINQQNVPEAARAFLNGAAGSTQLIAGQGGWILIHVDRIIPGDPKAQAGLIEASRREVGSALPGEMAEGLAKASMAAVGVDKNDATIKKLRQRLSGDGLQ
ncbi:peptidylprolyl isomerase [Sandarakinorhabdus sp. AAP62]|uniref:peptidylprolyl isomerase n=1 Tax=Sandarakinorhabdus sp. AAP62 TaxID=1248916 RepID=UPI0002DE6AA1|nr:peptidylprolyl isomerase [Sandarakinorhabdus sp. AAP62]